MYFINRKDQKGNTLPQKDLTDLGLLFLVSIRENFRVGFGVQVFTQVGGSTPKVHDTKRYLQSVGKSYDVSVYKMFYTLLKCVDSNLKPTNKKVYDLFLVQLTIS